MPTPGKDETEKEFISRCIPIVLEEGTAEDQDQAIAICYDIWRENKSGEKPKFLTSWRRIGLQPIRQVGGQSNRYQCYAVMFGDPDTLDWYGTYFDRNTNFHLDWYKSRPWLYDHTMNTFIKTSKIGDWIDIGIDDKGIFVVGELIQSHEYKEEIELLLKHEVLYPSTGSLSYVIDWPERDGHIKEWPIVELSSTTRPAEFRMEAIAPEVAKAIRSIEGGNSMNMNEMLEELLNRLRPRSVEESEPEATPEPVAAVEPVQEPIVPRAVGDIREINATLEQIVVAVGLLDGAVESLGAQVAQNSQVLVGLAESEVQRLKNMANTGEWFQKLYVASQQGDVVPEDQRQELSIAAVGQTPTTGGLLDPIINANR